MSTSRTLLEVDLAPMAGSRFQPTGFPDLGAAEFDTADGTKALLVESAQSMANRLEATTWDEARKDQAEALSALPYVRIVNAGGVFLSSSRLEAHRLASAYIMQGTVDGQDGEKWMLDRLGLVAGRPLDHRAVARACFALDPVSLIHGVFLRPQRMALAAADRPRRHQLHRGLRCPARRSAAASSATWSTTRARTGDHRGVRHGAVPRVEYTAGTITAYFTIDHAQFRSYGLSESATALLEALADFEIATLLERDLRLRTACDLRITETRGHQPDAQDAAARITKLATDCAGELGPVTTVTWSGRTKAKGQ